MRFTRKLPPNCLFRSESPPRTPMIDGKVAGRLDLSALEGEDIEGLTASLLQRDNAAMAYDQMLTNSLAYYASEMIMGPMQEPYMGRFIAGRHHIHWDEAIQNHDRILTRAARDHGKTFFFTVSYPIWKADKRSPGSLGYIFSASQELAEERMEETRQQIEDNPKLQHLIPIEGTRNWSKREIRTSTGSKIRARGYGVRVRGGHPWYIVCDDVLKDEHLYSETQRGRATDYFFSAITNMVTPGGQLIVDGTPMHFADVYGQIEKTGTYHVINFPARDKAGTPLFPERYGDAALLAKKKEIGSARFAREFMCRPMTDEEWREKRREFLGYQARKRRDEWEKQREAVLASHACGES